MKMLSPSTYGFSPGEQGWASPLQTSGSISRQTLDFSRGKHGEPAWG
jgi:hypothetical protein